jgi:hypothetical protein
MRRHAHLYEINARLFLRRLSEKYGRTLTLATVPEKEWRLIKHQGFDLVWLMGVWQRSPAARQQALLNAGLRREYDRALPDWTDEDLAGSPYAVYDYSLDSALGGKEELGHLKARLNRLGLGLILDFVPNHLASDYPWTFSHPRWFVQGSEAEVRAHPDWFFSPDGKVFLAHGRDPYFPPWSDTVQVNFFSAEMRQALIHELLGIAEVADGVRCDMAMLALSSVFARVWKGFLKGWRRPKAEFWSQAIEQVKQRRQDFLFLAEAYWGMERELQGLGFDFTYDKALYDRLRLAGSADIRSHLAADGLYLERSAHFIENHDEPRAVTAFGRERSMAAALIMATVPGLRMFHDGQCQGRRIRLLVQLVREPKEVPDSQLSRFYERLLAICNASAFHEGEWRLLEMTGAWPGNESHHNLLAWLWQYGSEVKIVAVNYSPNPAQGRLKMPFPFESAEQSIFYDELANIEYVRNSQELRTQGLYIGLGPWQAHVFDLKL